MAYDIFLKIEGIKGQCTDVAHKEWIEVESFSHHISQPIGGSLSAGGTHTGGRADHNDFAIAKRMDFASPILFARCCDGRRIEEVRLELCNAAGEKHNFLKYEFRDVIIASVSPKGSARSEEPWPIEEITLRYGKITITYFPIRPDGQKGAAQKASWDTMVNKLSGG